MTTQRVVLALKNRPRPPGALLVSSGLGENKVVIYYDASVEVSKLQSDLTEQLGATASADLKNINFVAGVPKISAEFETQPEIFNVKGKKPKLWWT